MYRTWYLLIGLLLWRAETATQIGYLWSSDELKAKSDLVVIAALIATRDTGVRTEINDLQPPFPVVELNTEFKVSSILKGTLPGETFVLRHYRLDTDRLRGGVANGVHPLDFASPGRQMEYLLFLKRDASGIFVPISGHIFPGDSVFSLRKAG